MFDLDAGKVILWAVLSAATILLTGLFIPLPFPVLLLSTVVVALFAIDVVWGPFSALLNWWQR